MGGLSDSLDALERRRRDTDPAATVEVIDGLLTLLRDITEVGDLAATLAADAERAGAQAARLAGLIADLLRDPAVVLDEPRLIALALVRWVIKDAFTLAPDLDADDLRRDLQRVFVAPAATPEALPEALRRGLLVSALDDLPDDHLAALLAMPSAERALLALSLLSDRNALTPAGEAARTRLLAADTLYDALPANPVLRHLVAIVWMHCSYAGSATRHAIKPSLNRWFLRLAALSGLTPGSRRPARAPGDKPLLAIASESFRSQHAMFRWYAPVIRALRAHFTLLVLSQPEEVDAESLALFDRYVPITDTAALKAALRLYAPDAVYFPSVGMRAWAIQLANLRWAPVQLMTLGHPATTHAAGIDGVIVAGNLYGGEGVFSETVLRQLAPAGNQIEPHRGLHAPLHATPDPEAAVWRVAVPCTALKLNASYLDVLAQLAARSPRPITYDFFPNETGLAWLATRQRLQARFPGARVHPRASYADYLRQLAACHLALSPFPFGNSSSLVDVLLLGLPAVALAGREPHALTDRATLEAVGLPQLCVTTPEAYLALAVELLSDVTVWQRVRDQLADGRLARIHSAEVKPPVQEAVDTLRWAVAHPERLVERGALIVADQAWRA